MRNTRDGFKCFVDGKEQSYKALVSAMNPNEISIFESMRVYGNVIFRFDEHLKRLKESAHSCDVIIPSVQTIKEVVKKTLRLNVVSYGFLRITFQAGKFFIMLGERKHNEKLFQTGVELKTSSFRAPSVKVTDMQSKTGNYRLQLIAGSPQEAYEWLFLDDNHFLTEARIGNFFIVKKKKVLTPPHVSVLNGITREVVIECAQELGLSVQETPLTRHDAFNADEAFLTNTSWEILPVCSLDGRLVQESVPGPITLKLINYFHRKVRKECQPQKKLSRIQK